MGHITESLTKLRRGMKKSGEDGLGAEELRTFMTVLGFYGGNR